MASWGDVLANQQGTRLVRHAVLTYNGTWGAGRVQYPGDVVNGLAQYINPDLCYEVACPYPATFGPIGGSATAPSYQQSITDAYNWSVDWLESNPTQTFAMIGYSQGAEAESRVAIDMMGGPLAQHANRWIGGITFGNPCRGTGFIAPGVADPGGRGISSVNMTTRPTVNGEIVWADYVHSPANGDAGLDMYGSVPVGETGTIMTDIYTTATAVQLNDGKTFLTDMVKDILQVVEDSGVIKGLSGGVPGLLALGATALISLLVGLVTGPKANATGISADVQAALAGLAFLAAQGGPTGPHVSYLGEIPGYSNLVAKAVGFLYQIATLTPAAA